MKFMFLSFTVTMTFKCATCGREFEDGAHLRRHTKTHEPSSDSYPCEQCDKVFSRRDSLQRHVQQSHTQEGILRCDECGHHFTRRSNLQRHTRTAHNNNNRGEQSAANHQPPQPSTSTGASGMWSVYIVHYQLMFQIPCLTPGKHCIAVDGVFTFCRLYVRVLRQRASKLVPKLTVGAPYATSDSEMIVSVYVMCLTTHTV